MGAVHYLRDGMRNLLTGLGGDADKGAQNRHYFTELADTELLSLYCASWVGGKIVDIPAQDATKKWRDWTGSGAEEVKALEARLGLQRKVMAGLIRGRLWGGGAILIGTRDTSIEEPLDPDTVGRDGLEFLTVFDRLDLAAGSRGQDPTEEYFGQPESYNVATPNGLKEIHPTRLVLFSGIERPARSLSSSGWGMSHLQRCVDAVRHHDGAMADLSSLLKESKIDVLKAPKLTERITEPGFEEAMKNRLAIVQQSVGNARKVVIDKEEEWQSFTYGFTGLAPIMYKFSAVEAGAADIPMTRLFGQSPGGLNSSGESDLANYYDNVASMQRNEIGPAMSLLDRVMMRSATGAEPDDLKAEWRALRQMTEKEQAEMAQKAAETIAKLAGTAVFEDDELAEVGDALMRRAGVNGLLPEEG